LIELSNEFLISDSGLPDEINNHAEQWPVGDLPDEPLPYLLGSRYCDTTTFMTVLNSDTTTPDAIGMLPKDTRNASPFAATSLQDTRAPK
jgi:hypothetical protein